MDSTQAPQAEVANAVLRSQPRWHSQLVMWFDRDSGCVILSKDKLNRRKDKHVEPQGQQKPNGIKPSHNILALGE